jgi:dihydrolipoamide dehydrogenase (EC 1.8.1.4)
MSDQFDLIVIGAGPGGYVCAIRAAQLGMKVACVEKTRDPRRHLPQCRVHTVQGVAAIIRELSRRPARFCRTWRDRRGGPFRPAQNDGPQGRSRHREHQGRRIPFQKNKVTWLKGEARFKTADTITIGTESYTARFIVIATGSESVPLPGVAIDETRIVTSTGAIALTQVPHHLVVIGGGYIGLELGSVWHRLGAEVTVVEFLDRLVPTMDGEIATAFQKILTKSGMKFRLGTKVTKADTAGEGVALTLEPAAGGTAETLTADVVLVAIGRRAHTENLGLDAIGVSTDARGRVVTDAHFATNVKGIYAIGDVIAGPMLAHKAEEEGVALAEILAGQAGHVNYGAIPGVVYTWPEIASVGQTEEELKAAGIAYKVGKFPFMANGRARAMGDTDGFVKLLSDKATDRLLGAHIIGPDAGTIIAELVMAIEFGASAEDVARTSHAHPTLNEAVKEAALAVDGRALHI